MSLVGKVWFLIFTLFLPSGKNGICFLDLTPQTVLVGDKERRRVCKASVIKLLQIATCLIFIRVTVGVGTDFYS